MAARRLDRSRDFATVTPPLGNIHYVQDYGHFNAAGDLVGEEDPPPKPKAAQPAKQNGPASNGAVSLSAPPPPPPLKLPSDEPLVLTARTANDWQTENWPKLRAAIIKQLGVNPANKLKALEVLKERNLIVEG